MLITPNNRRFRPPAGEAMVHRSRVLVVEDDPLVSGVVVDALKGSYEISQAETSAEALECLQGGGVDVILLDCGLPGGLDPRLVPLADDAGIPVILMSGHPDMMERVPGAKRLCIQKPFRLAVLLETIDSVVLPHRTGLPTS